MWAAALMLLLAGCGQQIVDNIVPPAQRQFSEKLIADLQAGRDGAVLQALAPELRGQLAPQLPRMRSFLPQGAPRLIDTRVDVVHMADGSTVRHAYLAYEIDRDARHALVRIGLQQTSATIVTDLYVNRLDGTVEQATSFSLRGKSAVHYLILLLAILSFAIIVAAIVLIARTRGLRRKWLWIVGSLLGIGQVAIDWNSGAISVQPFYLQLLGAFAIRPGALATWQVGFGIPVVAILFLIRRARARRQEAKTLPEVFS
jgi:hypothetical protein